MSKRIAKRLFEIRHRFPKLRGAPTFAEPTWETIGEDAQRAFIDLEYMLLTYHDENRQGTPERPAQRIEITPEMVTAADSPQCLDDEDARRRDEVVRSGMTGRRPKKARKVVTITPKMIEAGYGAVRRHDVEAYDPTPGPHISAMLADVYRSMLEASGENGCASGV